MASDYAIEVQGLQKSFDDLQVLRDVSFKVKRGSIFALLGPNGAGKTTTVRILSTLLGADGGKAAINGSDVASDPASVRASIGLTGQFAAVDGYLSGEENLRMIGTLTRLTPQSIDRRTKELLQQFDLVEAGQRPVNTYSGGMKRRIDLAMSLIAAPPVLFLDEPTTGLDPRSRLTMWSIIKDLAANGTTILLTTQYMDEADHLADNIVVIDDGKVIAEGTADHLKSQVGADRIELALTKAADLTKAQKLIGDADTQVDEDRRVVSVTATKGVDTLKEILQQLEAAKIDVDTVSLHRPSLDDVFLALTGHTTEQEDPQEAKHGK